MATPMPGIIHRMTPMDNPGSPDKGRGPNWAKTFHDHLMLPSGKTIGETPNEELRVQLHRLGVENAHVDGRDVLASRYMALVKKVYDDAGQAAVDAWLASKR